MSVRLDTPTISRRLDQVLDANATLSQTTANPLLLGLATAVARVLQRIDRTPTTRWTQTRHQVVAQVCQLPDLLSEADVSRSDRRRAVPDLTGSTTAVAAAHMGCRPAELGGQQAVVDQPGAQLLLVPAGDVLHFPLRLVHAVDRGVREAVQHLAGGQ